MIKRQKFTTPKGTFGYPCALQAADTHFSDDTDPNDKGDFKGRLILPTDSKECRDFQAKLEMIFADHILDACGQSGKRICTTELSFIENEEFHQAVASCVDDFSKKRGKNPNQIRLEEDNVPWGVEVDKEGEMTGNTLFRLKLKARVVKRNGTFFDQRPKVFNAQNVLMKEVPNVGPGTVGLFAGQCNCWMTSKIGMTLWLEAAKILELVEGSGGQTADGYGFGDEEGSYTESGEFETALEGSSGDF